MDGVLSLVEPYLGRPVGSAGGENVKYRCPFHKEGKERRPAFYLNTNSGLAFCHVCNEGWNLVQLLQRFAAPSRILDTVAGLVREGQGRSPRPKTAPSSFLPEALTGVFHRCPVSLLDKGFSIDVLRAAGVGIDPVRGWVTYPLRDHLGRLVAFSARTDDKYRLYGPEELRSFLENYRGAMVEKSRYLWNFHRVYPQLFRGADESPVVIVEGYKACLWLIQHGFPNTVALQGSYLSDDQATLLKRLANEFILCLDQDDAGAKGTLRALKVLGSSHRVRVVEYPRAGFLQPDDLSGPEVAHMISTATRKHPMANYGRTTRDREKDLGRGKKGGGRYPQRYRYAWAIPTVPEKVRFIEGFYGLCAICKGHVDCDPDGTYSCENTLWERVTEKNKDGHTVETFRNKGKCVSSGKLDSVSPAAILFNGWVPGGGTSRKGTEVVCNCWGGRLAKPCNLCAHEAETKSGARKMYAHTLVRLRQFHLVEFKSDHGGDPYKKKVECDGGPSRCQWCKDKNPEFANRARGKLEYINIGYGHYGDLMGIDRTIGRKCKSCEDGQINTVGWCCTHCGHMLVDVQQDTTMTLEDLEEFGQEEQKCPSCRTTGYPHEEIECYLGDFDDNPQPGCKKPERAGIFDVDIEIKKVGEGKKTSLQLVGQSKIKPIDADLEEIAKPLRLMFLAEMDPAEQAKKMNRPDLFADGVAAATQTGRSSRASEVSY